MTSIELKSIRELHSWRSDNKKMKNLRASQRALKQIKKMFRVAKVQKKTGAAQEMKCVL